MGLTEHLTPYTKEILLDVLIPGRIMKRGIIDAKKNTDKTYYVFGAVLETCSLGLTGGAIYTTYLLALVADKVIENIL
jgi:hypothetical protein